MENLTFQSVQINGRNAYAAEFTLEEGVANVHFERSNSGAIVIKKRMSNAVNWSTAKTMTPDVAPLVFDSSDEFIPEIYPMYYRIESFSPVSNSIIMYGERQSGGSSSSIASLQSQIDAINGVGDTTDAIDTLPEMKAAFAGLKNTDTIKSTVDNHVTIDEEGEALHVG